MKKGFTLIELMIVVVIIGILAAIAIPKFSSVKDQAETVSCKSNMRSLATGESMYFGLHNEWGSIANLSISIMENADQMRCPTNNAAGEYDFAEAADIYTITCPDNANTDHGSVVDGITSWQ